MCRCGGGCFLLIVSFLSVKWEAMLSAENDGEGTEAVGFKRGTDM